MDEFHLLLKEGQTAAYSVEIWKRGRKWGGMPTGITQNVKDLLASREIENIDLVDALRRIMDIHTQNYKEDFELDAGLLHSLAASQSSEDKHLLWRCV